MKSAVEFLNSSRYRSYRSTLQPSPEDLCYSASFSLSVGFNTLLNTASLTSTAHTEMKVKGDSFKWKDEKAHVWCCSTQLLQYLPRLGCVVLFYSDLTISASGGMCGVVLS